MKLSEEVQQDLEATEKIIKQMKKDPSLLQDEVFKEMYEHAREKRKTIIKRLQKQLGLPEPSPLHLQAPPPSPPCGRKSHHPRHPEALGNAPKSCHLGHTEASGHSDRVQEASGAFGDYSRSSEYRHQRISQYQEISESTYQNLAQSGASRASRPSRTPEYVHRHMDHLLSPQRPIRSSLSPKGPLRIAPDPAQPSISSSQTLSRYRSEVAQAEKMVMIRAQSLHARLSSTVVQDILKEATDKHLSPSGTSRPSQSAPRSKLHHVEPERGHLKPAGIHGASRPKTASHIPTSSAMPSGHLLTSTMTKHIPRHPVRYQNQFQHENLATSSHVVEESFLEDGLSTTRDAPTIIDEVVDMKNGKVTASSIKKAVKTVHMNTIELPKRSKSMQNVSVAPVPRSEYIPQTTIPKPFQLSMRKSTGNTYSKKFVLEMMEEKKKQEETDAKSLKSVKFRAKPVPKSTYEPTNTYATEIKYLEAMRKKVERMAKKKFDAQNEMVRSKSEGNLATIKPPGYVPPSTYISPIPVKPNARSRSATTRAAILIQEATTPKGIKSHRATSNFTHHLRHGRCKLDTSTAVIHRRVSPPDFQKIHAKVKETYHQISGKPSTVPVPFNFESRSHSASTRHTNCKEKEPEMFKKSQTGTRRIGSANPARIPSTHAVQLREELNRAKIEKEKAENGGSSQDFWKEDNRKKIATFLGTRSKTDEDIAIRTRRKIQQQQETTENYMRHLAEMKQRVLNGPLIMEKQTALAQEHRLKRKFAARMKDATTERASSKFSVKSSTKSSAKSSRKASESSRRGSEASAAGTFVVEKEYEEDFDEEEPSEKDSDADDESGDESESESGSESEKSESEKSESGSEHSSSEEGSDAS